MSTTLARAALECFFRFFDDDRHQSQSCNLIRPEASYLGIGLLIAAAIVMPWAWEAQTEAFGFHKQFSAAGRCRPKLAVCLSGLETKLKVVLVDGLSYPPEYARRRVPETGIRMLAVTKRCAQQFGFVIGKLCETSSKELEEALLSCLGVRTGNKRRSSL